MMNNKEKNDSPTLQDKNSLDIIHALRTAHQYQTQLIILADQKANILIGIVAIILTILFTRADFLTKIDAWLLIPLAGFVSVEVAALFLALLVIMPKTVGRLKTMHIEDLPNPLFFGFFTKFKEQEYVTYLTNKLDSNLSARELLTSDLYQIGLVLQKKYTLLKQAYSLAVVGIILLIIFTIIFLFVS